jgi:hypothetical protein
LRQDHEIDIEADAFVRGVYDLDLIRFSKGIYKHLAQTNRALFLEKELAFLEAALLQREEHVRRSLEHIVRGRKKQIVIFLDNADQRNDATQQETFLIAQEFAEHWPVAVFVALRPETYHRSLKIGALSGYHPKSFTIGPPRIDRVIERRLQFATKITSGEIHMPNLRDITVRLATLHSILHVLLYSLRENRQLLECIENISHGNVRLALDMVKGFLGSGHVDTQKILDIYQETGSYTVPIHEFLRAVIFGDAEYFDPDRSPIANIFDVSTFDPKEHFLVPIAVALISAPTTSSIGEGFAETSRIYERLQGLGYTPEQIDNAVIRAHDKKMIETAARLIPEPGKLIPEALRATSVGVYHVARLARDFVYVDAMVVDTPIFDEGVRQTIRDVSGIRDRLERAERFREYLDRCWQPLNELGSPFDWPTISADLKKHINRVEERTR